MKKQLLIILIFTLFNFYFSYAQVKPGEVKAYAYSQATLSGKKPSNIVDENGKEMTQKIKSSLNYLFYLEFDKELSITPAAIWFKGNSYSAKANQVENTPVEMTDLNIPGQPKKTILVPGTTGNVLFIQPDYSKMLKYKPGCSLRKLLKKSEVVFEYTLNGKRHYKAVEKITLLAPVAAQ